jgi:hypothetical protein
MISPYYKKGHIEQPNRMTNEQIISGNALIARFMGYEIDDSGKFFFGIHYYQLTENVLYKDLTIENVRSCTEGFVWHYKSFSEKRYDNSWDWLMPVLEKIGGLYYKGFPIVFSIAKTGAFIGINQYNASGDRYEGQGLVANTLNSNYFANAPEEEVAWIEAVWNAVTIFIKWHNENKL